MNFRLRRLRLSHLRLILTLAVDLLTLAETVYQAFQTWPLVERRTGPQYRLLGDQRQTAPARAWWWPFADPTPERTPQVVASSIFGMSLVLVTGLVTASQGKFGSLLFIPAYGLFLIVILTTRAWRLAQVSS